MSATASRPLILITNDDGIQAKGIQALAGAMVKHGDVVVVAPDRAQSGMGHAVTINGILKMEQVTFSPMLLILTETIFLLKNNTI